MRTPGPFLGAALAALIALTPAAAPASDDPATAAEFFRAASAAFARGEYKAAALSYEEADRRAPRPITICNAGLAWDAAGDKPRAADDYRAAIDRGGLEEPQASHAASRLAALENELGTVFVAAPIGAVVSVAHATRRAAPTRIHLPPGEAELSIEHADRSRATKAVVVRAGEEIRVALEPPRPAPIAHREAAPPRDVPRGSSTTTWGWIALGGSAGLTGLGLVLGVTGLSARDDFVAGGRHDLDLRDDAITRRTWANVAFGGAALLGGVGALLLLTSPRGTPAPARATRVRVAPGLRF